MGVPLKVTGSIKGTTLKKTEPLLYSIPFVNVLESGNKSWGGCLCEDIITSDNNDLAQKNRMIPSYLSDAMVFTYWSSQEYLQVWIITLVWSPLTVKLHVFYICSYKK